MQPITLYTNPQSRGRNVLWMLEECGAEYEPVLMAYGPELKSPEYLAINPMGKLPALKIGDTVITETAAILTFLAECYPEKQLIPAAGTPERGEYYRWLMFALHAEYALMDQWFKIEETEARRRAIGYGDSVSAVGTLEGFLSGKTYALGERFSVLDLYLSGLIAWATFRAQVLPADGKLMQYAAPHFQRPAFLRAEEISAQQTKTLEG